MQGCAERLRDLCPGAERRQVHLRDPLRDCCPDWHAAGKLARYLAEGSSRTSVSVPEVDLPTPAPGRHRILHFHRNVPGVLSKMHGILAEGRVNIHAEYLQSTGELSYVILDVDSLPDDSVPRQLSAIEETIRLRHLH